jgi:hypothetical protein
MTPFSGKETPFSSAEKFDYQDPAFLANLYRWHKVCLRIYGLLTYDLDRQVEKISDAVGANKRQLRKSLSKLLEEDMPVVLGLYALEQLQKMVPNLPLPLQEMLLPCFSLSYSHLFARKGEDPLKYLLSRIDWFLDETRNPEESLSMVLGTIFKNKLKDPGELLEYLQQVIFPEARRRIMLAWRSEFP